MLVSVVGGCEKANSASRRARGSGGPVVFTEAGVLAGAFGLGQPAVVVVLFVT